MVHVQHDGALAATPNDHESAGSFAWFVIKLALAVFVLRSFVVAPYSIPSESMLPRLWNGDYFIATKWSYGYSRWSLAFNLPLIPGQVFADLPERGEVAVFKHPVDKVDYIKRIVGLPGDSVAMKDGQVILNGTPVRRERIGDFTIPISPNTACPMGRTGRSGTVPTCTYTRFREILPGGKSYDTLDFGRTPQDDFDAIIVPRGTVFAMGDNRDNSQDSRFPAAPDAGVGLVPRELLVARASMIVWSTDGSAAWLAPWTWFTAARWDRIGDAL